MSNRESKSPAGITAGKVLLSASLLAASAAYAYWQQRPEPPAEAPAANARSAPLRTASARPESAPVSPPDITLQSFSPEVTPPAGLAAAPTTPATPSSSPPQASAPQDTTPPEPAPAPQPDYAVAQEIPPTPAPAAAPQPKRLYADGEFAGDAADTVWGAVQIKAIIRDGALSDVQYLQYPSHRRRSAQISNWALPMLASEAIQAQSAQVDIVSQASITAYGFRQSLASALRKAKNQPG